MVAPDWWNSVEQGWNKSGHIPGDALEQFCGSGRTIRGRQRAPKGSKTAKKAFLAHKQVWGSKLIEQFGKGRNKSGHITGDALEQFSGSVRAI